MELWALRECIQERDTLAVEMAAAQEDRVELQQPHITEEDVTVFESRAKGTDLYETLSHMDTFEEDIRNGYQGDPLFQKILEKVELHEKFSLKDRFLWTRNRGGEDVVCVPSGPSMNTTLQARIVEQGHSIVGHFGPQRTADYIRRWYWWPCIYIDVEKYCQLCKTCT